MCKLQNRIKTKQKQSGHARKLQNVYRLTEKLCPHVKKTERH